MSAAPAILADPDARPYCSGIASIMLAAEEDCGRRAVWPHHKRLPAWFNPADWSSWPVLSYDKTELHIVAIASARKGAFRRLLDAAAEAGLSPVIVEPIGPVMPALMRKWGWQMTVVGEGWDRREEWRPRDMRKPPEGLRPEGAQGEARQSGDARSAAIAQTSQRGPS